MNCAFFCLCGSFRSLNNRVPNSKQTSATRVNVCVCVFLICARICGARLHTPGIDVVVFFVVIVRRALVDRKRSRTHTQTPLLRPCMYVRVCECASVYECVRTCANGCRVRRFARTTHTKDYAKWGGHTHTHTHESLSSSSS